MKYEETYVRLNWKLLNELGITRPENRSLLLDPDGCNFIKKDITCFYCLAFITYMACFQEINAFSVKSIYLHFFHDNRGNAGIFEMAFQNLFDADIVTEVP